MAKAINLKPDLVAGQAELAKRLGVTRQTITEWRKQGAPDPTSNNHWSVPDWQAWMEENGKSPTAGGEDEERDGLKSELAKLKVEKERESVRKLRINNDKEEKLAISREEVEEMAMKSMVALNSFFDALPDRLAIMTEGVHEYYELKRIFLQETDQMKRFMFAFADWLTESASTSSAEGCQKLKALMDSLRAPSEPASVSSKG
jgi:hypothetical protein